jgi:parallel beta-helix repeat protein
MEGNYFIQCSFVIVLSVFISSTSPLMDVVAFPSASRSASQPTSVNQTWYVDDDNTQGPWDGNLEHPFQHINDALGNASDHDTVFVFSGSYHEHITVDKPLQIVGEDRLSTLIDAENQGTAVAVHASEVTLSRFTVTGGGSEGVGGGVIIFEHYQNDVVSDNIICGNQHYGVALFDCTSSIISNNTISDNQGVIIRGQATHHVFSGNILRNDTLVLDDTSNTLIWSNSFQRSGIFQENGGSANTIEANSFDESCISLCKPMRYIIVNNTFVHSKGIRIDGNSPEFWRYHVIEGNTLDGRPIFYSYQHDNITVPSDAAEVIVSFSRGVIIENLTLVSSYGIDLNTCHYPRVSNNTVIDSDGIRLDICEYAMVSGNHLVNSSMRIRSAFSKIVANEIIGGGLECIESTACLYTRNSISNYSAVGIYVETGVSNVFLLNSVKNTDYAVSLQSTWFNRFLFNDFINSTHGHATFVSEWFCLCHNRWTGNYWEGRWGVGPKVIVGRFNTHKWVTMGDHGFGFYIYLPFVNVDWLPSRNPHARAGVPHNGAEITMY